MIFVHPHQNLLECLYVRGFWKIEDARHPTLILHSPSLTPHCYSSSWGTE